eukprot:NODE_2575_length_1086_cov_3.651880_g2144_i0.p7 GENE.NODE_2575_length_1086_cov_3.651880_g2144_i0~~NODE_2575_length_1086_cov_3.651880_g2144_i0.p7  ORF type:complete len:53 (+),score=1.89 NODE_2575_length_1086_cov_3.651880_g2144_i0:566-724(+)
MGRATEEQHDSASETRRLGVPTGSNTITSLKNISSRKEAVDLKGVVEIKRWR